MKKTTRKSIPKRFLSLLLALTMVLSLMPTISLSALAEKTLSEEKADYKDELDRLAECGEAAQAAAAGKIAIDAATDAEGAAKAFAEARANVDEANKQYSAAKINAKNALDNVAAQYNCTEALAAATAGKTAIDAATSTAGVGTAKEAALANVTKANEEYLAAKAEAEIIFNSNQYSFKAIKALANSYKTTALGKTSSAEITEYTKSKGTELDMANKMFSTAYEEINNLTVVQPESKKAKADALKALEDIETYNQNTVNNTKDDQLRICQEVIAANDSIEYLTFEGTEDFTISMVKSSTGAPDVSLEYSVYDSANGGWGAWDNYDNVTRPAITVAKNKKIEFRSNAKSAYGASSANNHFSITSTGTVAASGSIMTIFNYKDEYTDNLPEYCFKGLFKDCTVLTSAPKLPYTKLGKGCYEMMFNGCTGLAEAPELPAKTLAESCYNSMFSCCTSLIAAPKLEATTLASDCYSRMFTGCTSLLVKEATGSTDATWSIPAASGISNPVRNMVDGTASGGVEVAVPGTGTKYYKVTGPVASIDFGSTVGVKKYASLQDAVDAASADTKETQKTVKVLTDVNLTASLTVAKNKFVTIDLNGHVLNGAGITDANNASVIHNDGNLTVTGNSTGNLKHYFTVQENGLWKWDDTNTANAKDAKAITAVPQADEVYFVTGGVITGGKGTSFEWMPGTSYSCGGGICHGSISNSIASFGVEPPPLELTLNNVSIVGNTADYGGGVCNLENLTMDGGLVSGNTATGVGGVAGSITLKGNATVICNTTGSNGLNSNLQVQVSGGNSYDKITIGENFTGSAGVSVFSNTDSKAVPGAFTTNGSEADISKFTPDSLAYKVKFVEAVGNEGDPGYVAAHLELVNYSITPMTDITKDITLENNAMTDAQAKAIMEADGGHTDGIVVYALSGENYSYLTHSEGWSKSGTTKTLAGLKAESKVYVIGTVTEKTEVTLEATVEDSDYTGSAVTDPTVTAKVDEATVTLTKDLVFTYYTADDTNLATPIQAPTDVGDYQLVIMVASDEPDYYGEEVKTFSIEKASNTITGLTMDDWREGETASQPTATAAFGGSITYEYKVQGADDNTYTIVPPTQKGNYTLRATSEGSDNYDADVQYVDYIINRPESTFEKIVDVVTNAVNTVVNFVKKLFSKK